MVYVLQTEADQLRAESKRPDVMDALEWGPALARQDDHAALACRRCLGSITSEARPSFSSILIS